MSDSIPDLPKKMTNGKTLQTEKLLSPSAIQSPSFSSDKLQRGPQIAERIGFQWFRSTEAYTKQSGEGGPGDFSGLV